jgi:hypothetical protein
MRPSRLMVMLPLALLIAACGGSGPASTIVPASPSTPGVSPTAPPPTPVGASPGGSSSPGSSASAGAPAELGYWLRMTTSQAIPPIERFPIAPTSLITSDGLDLVPGAVPMIFPGPLVTPLFARQVTEAGREQIVTWARELGLLDGKTDFTGDAAVPGGVTGTIELTVDGSLLELSGVPDLPSDGSPARGSPEAFAELWRRVSSLPDALPGEVGPEQPYEPVGYGILVGPPPAPPEGMLGNLQDWPLDSPLATFGAPVGDGSVRCGIVFGADASRLGLAFENGNQLSQWVQDPDTSATFGLTVRPIVPGEDPCPEIFGASVAP